MTVTASDAGAGRTDGEGGRIPYGALEGAAAGVAVVVPLLFINAFKLPSVDGRVAALPVLTGLGAVALPRVLRGPSRVPALVGLAWAGWACLCAALAPNLTVAVWGRYGVGTGLLFVLAVLGCWVLGASVGAPAAPLVERALLVACLANAGVAVLQQFVDLSPYGLALYGGRSAGLFGNPVYLAELLVGGLWLALCRFDRPGPAAIGGTLLLSGALAVSGSRFGLALAGVAVVALAARVGWRKAAAAAAVVAVGVALGTALPHLGLSGGGTTAVDRVSAAPASGVRPRLDTWRTGLSAVADRPLTGWGPNGFLAGTSSRRPKSVARSEGPDRLFADAHDVIVEEAVSTGVVGVGLFLWWLALMLGAVRRGAGRAPPLAGFGWLCLALMLVEPLHVGTTPVALLALGAACSAASGERDRRGTRRPRRAITGAVVAGVLVIAVAGTVVLATGLVQLRQADLSFRPAAAASAAGRLPRWGSDAATVAQLYQFAQLSSRIPGAAGQALTWRRRAAAWDPQDPQPWNCLGATLADAGNLSGAEAAFEHALSRNPWSQAALQGLAGVEGRLGHTALAAELRVRLSALGPMPHALACLPV